MTGVVAVLLAAGAGRRMGAPKALVRDGDGVPWVVRGARVLTDGGCGGVIVVAGAAADGVRAELLGEPVTVVDAPDWRSGMAASLRAGLHAAAATDAAAALVHLVDLPDVGSAVIRRMLPLAAPDALARASYGTRITRGHPVLIGRDHWAGIASDTTGDSGGRGYLATHDVTTVDCADLATGVDADRPADVPPGTVIPGAPRRTPTEVPS